MSKVLTVDKSIEFWEQGEQEWIKGKVKEVKKEQDFFVYALIEYWAHGKDLQIKIYREDWLK